VGALKYIEKEFPLVEVNLMAEYEMLFLKMIPKDLKQQMNALLGGRNLKGKNLPKIHNIMYYPARIPPSATRAVTLASTLGYSDSLSKTVFLKAIGLDNTRELARRSGAIVTLYMADPDRALVRELLGRDPKEVTVVDPMAGGGSIPLEALRLGFRTIAGDYNPVAYLILRATIEFPAKYGRRLVELLERESRALIDYAGEELGRFYGEDAGYIFFIGAEHYCGGLVPLAKHTMLDKKRNIHVKPVVDRDSKTLAFQVSKGAPAFSTAVCPYCGRSVSEGDIREKWAKEHTRIVEGLLDGNEKLAEDIRRVYILAAIQVPPNRLGGGRYRSANSVDIRLLIEPGRELARCALREKEEGRDIREYIPTTEIPEDNNVFRKLRTHGIRYWHQLFTPRQLLALYKLTKYIRSRAETLKRDYGELGVAVALYLSLALAKTFNYNNILTWWQPGSYVIAPVGARYALGKSVDLGYDYCEAIVPHKNLPWVLEAEEEGEEEGDEDVEATRGGILPVVRLLGDRLEGLWKDGLDAVFLWDARELDRHLPGRSVDLVNVDPPYYDQHDYAGITEFLWVIVQQALWPVLDDLFPPERVKINAWHPAYPEVPRGVEIRGKPPKSGSTSEFAVGFRAFLESASRVLKDDGLLVVWYAYGKAEGWEELFKLFYDTGYGVTKTWQVWTQTRQRLVASLKTAFFTSMVIVARPRVARSVLSGYDDPLFLEDVRRAVESSMDTLMKMHGYDALREALVTSLADGFSRATLYTLPAALPSALAVYQNLARTALRVAVTTVLEYLARGVAGHLAVGRLDPVSRLYTFLLIAATDDLNVSYDFASKVAQVQAAGDTLNKVRAGVERGALRLLSPLEVSKKFYTSNVGMAVKLLLDVRDAYKTQGLRAAEGIVLGSERDAVSLARLLASVAWSKLGLSSDERESVLRVLAGGGSG
jgi:putative DNA methylase